MVYCDRCRVDFRRPLPFAGYSEIYRYAASAADTVLPRRMIPDKQKRPNLASRRKPERIVRPRIACFKGTYKDGNQALRRQSELLDNRGCIGVSIFRGRHSYKLPGYYRQV